MSSSSDKELEQKLLEAGNKLAEPPSSVEELLTLLNQIENCLVKVVQSPSPTMQNALVPSVKALVADKVFSHTDIDVKVAVASCISEITRITAPDAPYDDDKMKDVFQLIVSSFENLADNCSRSYSNRTSILETVAKVRSCVVMLDLECDALIIEMFQHFLKAIRDYHPDNVFSSMETIMTLVLEESEEIALELLSPLLDSVRKGNEDVLPIARKLGEKVLECSAGKVKPYLIQAVNSMSISLDDYGEIVASICREPSASDEQNIQDGGDEKTNTEMAPEEPSPKEADLPKSPKSVVSNGVTQAKEDDSLVDVDPQKKDKDSKENQLKSFDASSNAESNMLDSAKEANAECNPGQVEEKKERKAESSQPTEISNSSHPDTEKEADDIPNDKIQSEDVASLPQKDLSVEAALSSENQNVSVSQPSSPKALGGDAAVTLEGNAAGTLEGDAAGALEGDAAGALEGDAAVSFPSSSGDLPDESVSNKAVSPKKKEKAKESAHSDDVPQRVVDVGSDLEEKPHKSSGRKISTGVSSEYGEPMEVDESKKESGTVSESEDKPLKQSSKKGDTSNNADGSSLKQPRGKKHRRRRKPIHAKRAANISDEADKEKMPSPKSTAVSTKDEPVMEETPKISIKRKSAVGLEKGSGSENYDGSLVGTRVKVWWPYDKEFYEGIIESFDATKKKHKVLYNDGEVEILNLKREKWEVIAHDSESDEEEAADRPSPDATPEIPLKKKAKTDQSSKRGKVDASQKKSGGASSKSKSTSGKSSKKAKEGVKSDTKSPDDSKNAKKTEDGNKTKDHASKTASKSKNDDLKASKSNKLKEEVSDTPKASKSKHETPKSGKSKQESSRNVTSSTKGKSSKSGGKSDNGLGKVKSSSSKATKETEDEEMSMDSGETLKSLKGKSGSTAKSESKSSKKRQRA